MLLNAWWEFIKEIGKDAVGFLKIVAPVFYLYCLICAAVFVGVFINIVATNGWPLWNRVIEWCRSRMTKIKKGGEQDAENESDRQNDPGFPVQHGN